MTEFEGKVLSDLSVLKNQMETVVGNGHSGRLGKLEDRIMTHDQSLQRMKGMVAAFGGLLTIIHVAIDYVASKH